MITLTRVKVLEHELHIIDLEINALIQEYYTSETDQAVPGIVHELIQPHARLVDQLAQVKRELRGK